MENRDFCRPTEGGNSYAFAPVVLPPSPHQPTEAEYNAAGYYRNGIEPPAPQPGKLVADTNYVIADGKCVAIYTYADAPNVPRTFSKLKIVAALMAADVWPQVKSYIEQEGLYDLFLAAQDFREDNEFFVRGKSLLMSHLGWDNAQVEAILSASEADA